MKRISLLKEQLLSNTNNTTSTTSNNNTQYLKFLPNTKTNPISALDYLNFSTFLTQEENNYIKTLNKYLSDNQHKISKNIKTRTFPEEILLDIHKHFPNLFALSSDYDNKRNNFSFYLTCAIAMEFAKINSSLTTFLLVHGGMLGINTIYKLGSEKQKKKYLKDMTELKTISSFLLTEPEYGSDATSLKTNVTTVKNGYIINGTKRWPGMIVQGGVMILWAKNKENNNNIEGFLIDKQPNAYKHSNMYIDEKNILKSGFYEIKTIENKLSMQAVQNVEITFVNYFIPFENKLPKGNNFSEGTSKMLMISRLVIAWAAIGGACGIYDSLIKSIVNTNNKGLINQIVQIKISTILGHIQSMLYMTKKISDEVLKGNLSNGKVSMAKAYNTNLNKEIINLAFDIVSNMSLDNKKELIEKIMILRADLESVHTFEGTHDLLRLVTGMELTGRYAIR